MCLRGCWRTEPCVCCCGGSALTSLQSALRTVVRFRGMANPAAEVCAPASCRRRRLGDLEFENQLAMAMAATACVSGSAVNSPAAAAAVVESTSAAASAPTPNGMPRGSRRRRAHTSSFWAEVLCGAAAAARWAGKDGRGSSCFRVFWGAREAFVLDIWVSERLVNVLVGV
jgi:hypothetical protein